MAIEQCGAHHENDKQCRAYAELTHVNISLNGIKQGGSVRLPQRMTVLLCPKHFVLSSLGTPGKGEK